MLKPFNLKCYFSGKKTRLILKCCELFLSMFLIQAHHFTPGYAFFVWIAATRLLDLAGCWGLKQRRSISKLRFWRDLQQRRSPFRAGELLNGISVWDGILYLPPQNQRKPRRNIYCCCQPCPVSPESCLLCGGVRQPFSHDHPVGSRLWGWKPCFPASAACSCAEKCLCFTSIFSGPSRTLGNVFIKQEAWLLPLGFYFPMHGKKLFWNDWKQGAVKAGQFLEGNWCCWFFFLI